VASGLARVNHPAITAVFPCRAHGIDNQLANHDLAADVDRTGTSGGSSAVRHSVRFGVVKGRCPARSEVLPHVSALVCRAGDPDRRHGTGSRAVNAGLLANGPAR
jgi:hypothetical protein